MKLSLEQLARVAAAPRCAVLITDREGLTVWANDGFTEISGYRLDEIVGKKPGRLLAGPDTERATVARIAAAVRAGRGIECDIVNYSKFGRRYLVGLTIEPWYNESGELDSFMAIEFDITERVARDEELRVMTSRLDLATRAALVGIFDYQSNTGEFWWNEMAYEIFRRDPNAFKPSLESWLALVHPDDRAFVRTDAEGGSGMPRFQPIQYRIIDDGGAVRHLFSQGEPSAAAGRSTGSFLDITTRIESEQRERALHEKLLENAHQAGIAQIATGVLHNVGNVLNSLGIANAMVGTIHKAMRLERLEKAGELLATNRETLPLFLTEDARGRHLPDYLIAMSAQLGVADKDLKAERETVDRLVNHLRDIVNAQQSVAMIGGLCQITDLRKLAETALLVHGMTTSNVEIVELYELVPCAQTDPHKVLQILVNYLSNAHDAVTAANSPPGRIVLHLKRDADHAIFSVTDSGVGMSADAMGRLWQFGYTTKPKGHGYGLHNSANAARAIGAEVMAASDGPGRGSSFTLRLPLRLPLSQSEIFTSEAAA
jgi:PAS domain S-box-containing protein